MGESDEYEGFEGGGPMIRIGSVGEAAYDVRFDVSQPWVPRPRASVDTGSAARPPAA